MLRQSGTLRRVQRLGLLGALVVTSACAGKWTVSSAPAPVRAVHAVLMHNGHVLLIAGSGNDPEAFAAGSFTSAEWDPVANSFRTIATPYDMFCSGHAVLPDGRVMVAGGTQAYPSTAGGTDFQGSAQSYAFDPTTHQYVQLPTLAEGHWYPTVVNRGDGKQIVVGGLDQNGILQSHYQTFDPAANGGAGALSAQQTTAGFFPTYPALHLLADGRFFYSGVSTFGDGSDPPGLWNADTNTFTAVKGLTDRGRRDMGASVLLPPAQDQRVMVMGGGIHHSTTTLATASTALIDLKKANPAYVAGPPMSESKQYVSAVTLPDRTVLQSGGTSMSYLANAVPGFKFRYTAQLFHPDTNTWEDAAKSTVGRTYHSEALLLPDGRVATFGSNLGNDGAPFESRIEIYQPKYFDKVRPVLGGLPANPTLARGATINFTSDRPLQWAELIRPGAATHSNDPDQRLVDLPITQNGTQVSAALAANPNLTPPGYYMLFGVDTDGTPSVATWVQVV